MEIVASAIGLPISDREKLPSMLLVISVGAGVEVLVGTGVLVGGGVNVAVLVEVRVVVGISVGVKVGPNNCPGPQAEVIKLRVNRPIATKNHCLVFIVLLRYYGRPRLSLRGKSTFLAAQRLALLVCGRAG